MANQPQCDSVVWQRKEVTDASLSREGGDIRICWITVLEDSAHAFASGAKMWQWGNSVTAYCVMSPWFLSYCAGDEREKNGEQRIQHMMKGSPCWWGICEALFKKAGWQRMRRRRRKNGWAQREKYIRPIVQLKRGSTQQTGGGGGGETLYVQPHACDQIFISRHLYSHQERAGVDYIDHATN